MLFKKYSGRNSFFYSEAKIPNILDIFMKANNEDLFSGEMLIEWRLQSLSRSSLKMDKIIEVFQIDINALSKCFHENKFNLLRQLWYDLSLFISRFQFCFNVNKANI